MFSSVEIHIIRSSDSKGTPLVDIALAFVLGLCLTIVLLVPLCYWIEVCPSHTQTAVVTFSGFFLVALLSLQEKLQHNKKVCEKYFALFLVAGLFANLVQGFVLNDIIIGGSRRLLSMWIVLGIDFGLASLLYVTCHLRNGSPLPLAYLLDPIWVFVKATTLRCLKQRWFVYTLFALTGCSLIVCFVRSLSDYTRFYASVGCVCVAYCYAKFEKRGALPDIDKKTSVSIVVILWVACFAFLML